MVVQSRLIQKQRPAVWVGANDTRRYMWYVSETQDQADEHVANIGAMLEASTVEIHYPRLAAKSWQVWF